MNKNLFFELAIIAIICSPLVFFSIKDVQLYAHFQNYFYLYLIAFGFFYLLPLMMQYLDSKKTNAEFLLKTDRRLRLIWAAYLASLGFILFYYSINELENDKPRLLGVALSLFLFASGNFRHNLHPSSIFSGNKNYIGESNISDLSANKMRKMQRLNAKLFFWVGVLGTIFFLYFKENILTIWGLIFIAIIIIYGIVIRLISSR